MFGSEVTYMIGSEASDKFWNSHNDDLNAEDLYANITRPVFGKGVAFDVPHKVWRRDIVALCCVVVLLLLLCVCVCVCVYANITRPVFGKSVAF